MPGCGSCGAAAERRLREKNMVYQWTSADGNTTKIYDNSFKARAKRQRAGGTITPIQKS